MYNFESIDGQKDSKEEREGTTHSSKDLRQGQHISIYKSTFKIINDRQNKIEDACVNIDILRYFVLMSIKINSLPIQIYICRKRLKGQKVKKKLETSNFELPT